MIAYLWNVIVWLDQGINTVFAPVLNLLFVRTGGHQFGNPDETVSSVLGKNHQARTCRVCSFICRHILDRIDHGHCSRSVEPDEGNG